MAKSKKPTGTITYAQTDPREWFGPDLIITVSGGTASGKTTAACLIARCLHEIGCDIALHDSDCAYESVMKRFKDKKTQKKILAGKKILVNDQRLMRLAVRQIELIDSAKFGV